MITPEALDRQERVFARAFAAGDLAVARPLYHPDVVYVSPTVRLFDWPQVIHGIDRTLEFITLTIRRCRAIRYEAVERAVVEGGAAAFVRIAFDWTDGDHRLRSRYVVLYRHRDGLIERQELYYDPSAPPEVVPG
jgi:ketosteroid isomerase-like protein